MAGFCIACPENRRHRDGRPARDRADLLFRAAAHARGAAHPRHDPHGGRRLPQAQAVPLFHRRGAQIRRAHPQRRAGAARSAGCCTALGDVLVYGPLKNVLGFSKRARRLHRGRGDRPRPVRVLSLDRAQPEAALRPDRSLPLSHRAAGRRDLFRHRRPGFAERRHPHRRRRRGAVQVARHVRRLFQGRGQDRRGDDGGRLREDRRRRLLRREDRASQDHRPRQGRRPAQRRHAVPAEIHREQAQVLPQHPRGGRLRRQARFRAP